MRERVSERAFTLIELSIVLVIIGLIVGGVLAGQSLIVQAQMRAQMKQIESFKTAVMTFRDKYGCLPGDCANATSFFPKDPNCGATGNRHALTAPNSLTCNGDGNGIVQGVGVTYSVEKSLFWQHLSLSGLIQGTYTGTCGYAGDSCGAEGFEESTNLDIPTAAFNNTAGVIIINPDLDLSPLVGANILWPQGGQHVFWLSGFNGTDGSGNPIWNDEGSNGPAMTAAQAFALDTKYDDGNPGGGSITNGVSLYAVSNINGKEVCMDGTVSPPQYWSAAHPAPGGTIAGLAPVCDLMFKAGF